MIVLTEDQAAALVTDPGTLKRGQELAGPAKWGNLGRTDTAAWGECAGSGSKPYLTGIDLTEPAFKCSCPSRVFPCKHGAGLLLLLARQPALLPAGTPPAWLTDWLDKRQAKETEHAAKVSAKKAAPADDPTAAPSVPSAAQQKRDLQRQNRRQAGAEELETWLLDLVRAGLAELGKKSAAFWETQAARLVDNQLPGLAARLRELAEYPTAGSDWTTRLLGALGETYVLLRAFLNRATLQPALGQDVEQQAGTAPKRDDLLAGPAPLVLADTWLVLGQYAWAEERLTGRRSWLYGQQSGRLALLLDFAFGTQAFATPLIPQGKYQGELVFYPGPLPLRAAPVALIFQGSAAHATPPGQSFAQLLDDYATALARQPWLRQWPATLAAAQLHPLPDGRWLLHRAAEATALPLRLADEEMAWQWLAFGGGQPLTFFGEWDGQAFCPLICWSEDLDATGLPVALDDFFTRGASASNPAGLSALVAAAPVAPAEVAPPASELPNWPQLQRVALLGTRQSTEALPAFAALPAAEAREQQVLLAAGTLALLHKAGYVPAAASTLPPLPAPAAADPVPTVGALGTEGLHRMLVQEQHQDLLPDYLRRLAEVGRRVPDTLLVPLLAYAAKTVAARADLAAVLGTRGRWLAALRSDWARLFTAPVSDDAADLSRWETGLLPERLGWLRARFGQDADAARALLLAALPTEPAKTQEALLELLAEHPHPSAEPVLEGLLKSRGQEVRRQAAAQLAALPGAALAERLWARAAPLLSVKRKMLGLGKATLEVTLPAWDKSWLADGIEEKNDHYGYMARAGQGAAGAGATRLANLLALVPVGRWLTHLQVTPTELLDLALASEWAVPLLPAWVQSTVAHRDAALAAAFVQLWLTEGPRLDKLGVHLQLWKLTALLSPATQRDLLVQPLLHGLRQAGPDQQAAWKALELAAELPGPWPWEMSQAALALVARHATNTATQPWLPHELQRFGSFLNQTLRDTLPPTDVPAALRLLDAIADPHESFAEQFRTFTDTLQFRQNLTVSLAEQA